MQWQLNTYRAGDGSLGEFAREWQERVLPLRRAKGFEVLGPWTTSERFLWLAGHDDLPAAEEEYCASPERAALHPDPARLIEDAESVRFGGSMTDEHPNAALTRRVFAAFGKDAMAISAAFSREIVWRVPGDTAVSGEYHGRRQVVEFLRRTGLETDGTYRSSLETVLANDEWVVAIYRAFGRRNGVDLDVDQAFVIRCEDGLWRDVTAVPLDAAFDVFWA
jgi:ketosteroid isomerase-like protein